MMRRICRWVNAGAANTSCTSSVFDALENLRVGQAQFLLDLKMPSAHEVFGRLGKKSDHFVDDLARLGRRQAATMAQMIDQKLNIGFVCHAENLAEAASNSNYLPDFGQI